MIDVILPVLDEAQALPGVLAAMPAGLRGPRRRQRLARRLRRGRRRLRRASHREPRRGFGAACFAGLRAAETEIVCFMDCDGSLDPARAAPRRRPGARRRRPTSASGHGCPRPGAWPWHARLANRAWPPSCAGAPAPRSPTSGRCGPRRREALLALGLRDRGSGWPLEMVLTGRGRRLADRRGRRDYGPRAGGRSKVSGSVRGTARAIRDMSAQLS